MKMVVDNDAGAAVTIHNERENVGWQKNTKTLNDGIRHIYETKEFSDAVYVVNGEQFRVHSLILSARSPAFKTIFCVKNPPTRVVDVCSTIGFKILIRYIYTDELGTTDRSEILEAHRVANKFQQPELIKECDKLIGGWEITIKNVFTILNIALDIELLRNRCLQFIKENSGTVLKSPDFFNLTPIVLVDLLEQKCFAEVPVAELLDAVLKWGLEQFPKLENCSKLREYLMGNQILGKLNLHKFSVTELLTLASDYPELLTAQEILQFQMCAMQPDKNLPLPSWAQK